MILAGADFKDRRAVLHAKEANAFGLLGRLDPFGNRRGIVGGHIDRGRRVRRNGDA